ncbi:MAG: hypothetical protein JXR63_10385 [Spirochaetales bacterium]|nr:hypothetical protein [Spirochaetales bacterium]
MKYKFITTFFLLLLFVCSCIPPKDEQYNVWNLCTYDLESKTGSAERLNDLPSTSLDINSFGKILTYNDEKFILLRNATFKDLNSRKVVETYDYNTYKISLSSSNVQKIERIGSATLQNLLNSGATINAAAGALYSYIENGQLVNFIDENSIPGIYLDYSAGDISANIIGLIESGSGTLLALTRSSKGFEILEKKGQEILHRRSFSVAIPGSSSQISDIVRIWDMSENFLFVLAFCKNSAEETVLKNVKINFNDGSAEIIDFPYFSDVILYMNHIINDLKDKDNKEPIHLSIRAYGYDFQSFCFETNTEKILVNYSKDSDKFLACHIPLNNLKEKAYCFKILNNDFTIVEKYSLSSGYARTNIAAMNYDGKKIIFLEQSDRFSKVF